MTKQIKPDEIQSIPAINYYASKEDLMKAIHEISKDFRNDFRWIIGLIIINTIGMIGVFIQLLTKH